MSGCPYSPAISEISDEFQKSRRNKWRCFPGALGRANELDGMLSSISTSLENNGVKDCHCSFNFLGIRDVPFFEEAELDNGL